MNAVAFPRNDARTLADDGNELRFDDPWANKILATAS